jgi:type IV secretion system protein VirB10
MVRDKRVANAEDTVLGNAGGEASDPYSETDGVPKKTKAQDDAEHGRAGEGSEKSAAQAAREKAIAQERQRRENDLQSSAVSVDFSDYFDKQTKLAPPADPDYADQQAARLKRTALERELDEAAAAGEPDNPETSREAAKKEAHDPKEDYAFDSSAGRLYRLMEDTILETVLVNRLAGASVGPVIVMVSTDVYSKGGRLLIPKGTRLLGHISAVSSLNQERLFVAFHRMIMPDDYSVSLDKFQGLDVVGQTGLRDLVNHHYLQIFGASLALAAVSATTQIGNNGGAYGTYDWGVSMRNGVSESLGQSGQRVMERFLNVLPTFTIRERSRVKVMLSGDLLLPDIQNHMMDPDL